MQFAEIVFPSRYVLTQEFGVRHAACSSCVRLTLLIILRTEVPLRFRPNYYYMIEKSLLHVNVLLLALAADTHLPPFLGSNEQLASCGVSSRFRSCVMFGTSESPSLELVFALPRFQLHFHFTKFSSDNRIISC